jgi:hypothetical protein
MTLTMASAPTEAHEDADYIYCWMDDISGSKVVYYTDVFLGNFSDQTKYSKAFAAFVQGKYNGANGIAVCSFDTDVHQAREKEDNDRASRRSLGKRIVNTGWTY